MAETAALGSVLIAEDELLVRIGLGLSVPWEQLGLRVAAEVASGDAALAAWQEHRPDIIITDLIMPGMDGVELIRRVREAGDDCSVIVVTCVNQPEAWREMQELDVSAYLIKATMTRREILDAVLRAREELAARRGGRARAASPGQDGKREAASRAEELLAEVLFSGREPDSGARQAFLSGGFRNGSALCARLGEGIPPEGRLAQSAMLILRDGAAEFGQVRMCLRHGDRQLLLLDAPLEGQWLRVERRLAEAARYLASALSVGVTFAGMPGDLSLEGMQRLCAADGVSDGCRWLPAGERPNSAAFAASVDGLLSAACAMREPERVYGAVRAVEELRAGFLADRGRLLAAAEGLEAALGVPDFGREAEAAANTAELCAALDRAAAALRERRPLRPELARVVAGIAAAPAREWPLDEAAAEAGLTGVYFSTLFHREMGQRFSDYCNALRVAAAKRLLRETDMSAAQVAEACGFRDISYFGRVFRQYAGMPPGAWRKSV